MAAPRGFPTPGARAAATRQEQPSARSARPTRSFLIGERYDGAATEEGKAIPADRRQSVEQRVARLLSGADPDGKRTGKMKVGPRSLARRAARSIPSSARHRTFIGSERTDPDPVLRRCIPVTLATPGLVVDVLVPTAFGPPIVAKVLDAQTLFPLHQLPRAPRFELLSRYLDVAAQLARHERMNMVGAATDCVQINARIAQ